MRRPLLPRRLVGFRLWHWFPVALLGAALILSACQLLPTSATRPSERSSDPRRIGVLPSGNPTSSPELVARALGELGYAEGRDFTLEVRPSSVDDPETVRAATLELVALGVELVVTDGPTPRRTWGAMAATTTTPIVFINVEYPVEEGVVASLSRPGGNVTGVLSLDWVAKAMDFLKEAFPSVSVVAIPGNPARPTPVQRASREEAARRLGLKSFMFYMVEPDAFDAALQEGAQGLAVLDVPQNRIERDGGVDLSPIIEFAASNRLPAIYQTRAWMQAGGLMWFGEDSFEYHRRAAVIIDKILKGANPAELPVERSTRFELGLNLKVAREQGFTFPRSILLQATEVIQ